jgi:hypothetical protein
MPILYPAVTIDASTVQQIFNNIDLYIAPLMNPDGHSYSRMPSPAINIWWRKNRHPMGGSCVDEHYLDPGVAVDVNRNFDSRLDPFLPEGFLARAIPLSARGLGNSDLARIDEACAAVGALGPLRVILQRL